MADSISYGWTGKILRVNLTTGDITTESTEPYEELYIGGMGLANKVLYDEVPANTDPFSPENKIIFAVGPLTATGVPLAGRTTISTLSCFTKGFMPVDAHCGGMIGARIKQAGWDAIIIEGASDAPVYINIKNQDVEIKDASMVWGLGTRETTEILSRVEGTNTCVACIGQAGENLLPYSCIINARNHSAGAGTGAVMGSKKCKGIVVEGTLPVAVADPQAVADLSDYMLRELIGSNNNHSTPSTQQEWAEYYDSGSRWTAQNGLYWAAAEGGPIETGEPKPGELNTIGYRCMKSTKDLGKVAEAYTVKMGGCHSCPIHCHADMIVEDNAEYSYMSAGNTCLPNSPWKRFSSGWKIDQDDETMFRWNMISSNLVDDLGLWCNYGQIWRDIAYCVKNGIWERELPPEVYNSVDWSKIERNDPTFLTDFLRKIAANDSDMSLVAHGTNVWAEKWGCMDWFENSKSNLISYLGFPTHHAADDVFQAGALYNQLFNRDCMVHSGTNFARQGFPEEMKHQIAEEIWGDYNAYNSSDAFTPINEGKVNFAWWCVTTDVLHDSLTLCNWVWPMSVSPERARDYRGDLDMEAKFFKAVTGRDVTTDDLYKAGARIMTLQRAMDVKYMGTTDLRNEHDRICEWEFTMDPDMQPFEEGTSKLDRDDMATAFTMLYRQFGWDEQLGCPTAECLDDYGMGEVKEDLSSLGLLP